MFPTSLLKHISRTSLKKKKKKKRNFSDLIATFQIMLWNCKLKTQCSLFSRLEHIFKDASCLLNGLRWVELKCVKRSANLVAHSLARYAREVSNEVIWLEDSPPLAMEAFYLNSISIQWMKVWILFHKEKKELKL